MRPGRAVHDAGNAAGAAAAGGGGRRRAALTHLPPAPLLRGQLDTADGVQLGAAALRWGARLGRQCGGGAAPE
jgi:hypothetical protein